MPDCKIDESYCDCCGALTKDSELIGSKWGCLCPNCRKNKIDCREWELNMNDDDSTDSPSYYCIEYCSSHINKPHRKYKKERR